MSDWEQLLSPTAATGHPLDGSPTSNLLWNCRTARSHSPTRRAHRTSRTLHSPRRSLPRGQADKDSLTRWTLGGRIREEQPADPRPDLRLQKRTVNDYAISRSRYLAIPLSRTLAHFEPQRATGLGRPLQVQNLRPPTATQAEQAEHNLHALPRPQKRLAP